MFPNGLEQYIIGGVLIGLGVGFLFVFNGVRAGVSTFFATAISYVSKDDFFQQKAVLKSRSWRNIFTLGLIVGALIYAFLNNDFFVTKVQLWRLILGGFLVGLGARYSRGCTSGHGVCGLASFNKDSLVAVLTFLVVAVITANLVLFLGVAP